MEANLAGRCSSYWTRTETYEALKIYIEMNYDGLKDSIVRMIAGEEVPVNTEKFQNDMSTFLTYNDENSLSCVIALAYYSAQNEYTMVREFPSGEGFADIVYIPRKHSDKPALVVELKYGKKAESALSQIRGKRYMEALSEYHGNLLLVGINYNKKTKVHECRIEKYQKQ